jgi:hypothetical protein
VEGDILAVLLAHGVRRAHPVAEKLLQLGDGGVDLRGFCLNLAGHLIVPIVRPEHGVMGGCQQASMIVIFD